jgi:hypothetical protein
MVPSSYLGAVEHDLGGPPAYRGPAIPVLRRHTAPRRPRRKNVPTETARKIAAALMEAADELGPPPKQDDGRRAHTVPTNCPQLHITPQNNSDVVFAARAVSAPAPVH